MTIATILIGGDICPVNRYQDAFCSELQDPVMGGLHALAMQSDLFVANLECPLIERPSPILKTGPVLGASLGCVTGLKAMNLHALGLANNHIMDHGAQGLASTQQACRRAGIVTFGAGANLTEARQIQVLDIRGVRVGLMAMAEREWSLASDLAPGANPFSLMNFVRDMREIRTRTDCLIVLVHAGSEGYELPSPELQDACRFLVEEGASLVTCQHSHCVGSYEYHQGKLIFYGQGNFIFDYASHGPQGSRGVLISMEIGRDASVQFKIHPFAQRSGGIGIDSLAGPALDAFWAELERRSERLPDADYVRNAWEAFCQEKTIGLFNEILGYGRLRRRLNSTGSLLDMKKKSYFRNLLSIVQNESASEILRTSLGRMLGRDASRRPGP